MYVENDKEERIPCGHPCEDSVVEQVLGVSYKEVGLSIYSDFALVKPKWWWSKKKKSNYNLICKRTGYNSCCICLDCLKKMDLDLGDEKSKWRYGYGFNRPKDDRICNRCNSYNVRTVFESIGHLCPTCKAGKISEIVTGWIC